jgi:transmembrane sensor
LSSKERLKYLLEQAALHRATHEEYEELLQLISDDEAGEIVRQLDAFHGETNSSVINDNEYDYSYWQAVVKEVLKSDKLAPKQPGSLPSDKKRIHFLQRYWWAAACMLLLIAGAYYLLPQTQPPAIVTTLPVQDIAPGGNKAILTLADGSRITLDSARNGMLAQQGSTSVTKLNNGQLAYSGAGTINGKVLYNTMSTPLGGQYKLILSDGTAVWLNAGSSITYPTAFTGNERSVTITGEAYFEVAKNKKMPFRVKANNTVVEVLGTHFNINAYKDESSINTTLLEGAVQISAHHQQQLLKPGQQARVQPQGQTIAVMDNVNLLEVMAWKEGFFYFNDADLPTVMRQLARWYNVDVKYEGTIPDRVFTGEIGRDLTLSQVLKGLTKTRVKYKIEDGNRIIIHP